jgi:predicted GNAT family acetyltransferase
MSSESQEMGGPHPVRMQRLEMERNGQIAFVNYSVAPKDGFTLWHTEVPESLRGTGLGGELVRKALAFAQEKELAVKIICPFAREYIARHNELQMDTSS